jgi:hypothetical protein
VLIESVAARFSEVSVFIIGIETPTYRAVAGFECCLCRFSKRSMSSLAIFRSTADDRGLEVRTVRNCWSSACRCEDPVISFHFFLLVHFFTASDKEFRRIYSFGQGQTSECLEMKFCVGTLVTVESGHPHTRM